MIVTSPLHYLSEKTAISYKFNEDIEEKSENEGSWLTSSEFSIISETGDTNTETLHTAMLQSFISYISNESESNTDDSAWSESSSDSYVDEIFPDDTDDSKMIKKPIEAHNETNELNQKKSEEKIMSAISNEDSVLTAIE